MVGVELNVDGRPARFLRAECEGDAQDRCLVTCARVAFFAVWVKGTERGEAWTAARELGKTSASGARCR